MVVTSSVKIDLIGRSAPDVVSVMQNDEYSRNIAISLYYGGVQIDLQNVSNVLISYKKPDGRGGVYDVLPSGETAWSVSGNVVTVKIAPQVCTVSGSVPLSVGIVSAGETIYTFPVLLDVGQNPGISALSEDYYSVIGAVPSSGWTPNAYLGTNEFGNVVALQGVGGLPTVTGSDNGKFLRVVNGAWAAASVESASGVQF